MYVPVSFFFSRFFCIVTGQFRYCKFWGRKRKKLFPKEVFLFSTSVKKNIRKKKCIICWKINVFKGKICWLLKIVESVLWLYIVTLLKESSYVIVICKISTASYDKSQIKKFKQSLLKVAGIHRLYNFLFNYNWYPLYNDKLITGENLH